MNCPKCQTPMDEVEFGEVQVDRCPNCLGIFFDELEREALEKMPAAEALDIGHPKIGAEYNKIDHIECPRCGGGMMRMVAPGQHHIWFEQCKACGGSFLDAGEFRDLKERTLTDFLKDLLTGARP